MAPNNKVYEKQHLAQVIEINASTTPTITTIPTVSDGDGEGGGGGVGVASGRKYVDLSGFVADYSNAFDTRIQEHRTREEKRQHKAKENMRMNQEFMDVAPELRGDALLNDVRAAINSCGLTMTESQQAMHTAALQACLEILYGTEFAANRDRIMKEQNLEYLSQEVLVVASRRFGKSVGTSVFVAAMTLVVPQMHTSVFSQGRRASKALMDLFKKYLQKMDGFADNFTIVTQNSEAFIIRSVHDPDDLRKAFFYPSSRGVTKHTHTLKTT